MGMLNCAQESNNGTIAQSIVRGKVSKVKCTFLKSVRGKKFEGQHGVWFGGE